MTTEEKLELKLQEALRDRTYLTSQNREVQWLNRYVDEFQTILNSLNTIKIRTMFAVFLEELDNTKTKRKAEKAKNEFIKRLIKSSIFKKENKETLILKGLEISLVPESPEWADFTVRVVVCKKDGQQEVLVVQQHISSSELSFIPYVNDKAGQKYQNNSLVSKIEELNKSLQKHISIILKKS